MMMFIVFFFFNSTFCNRFDNRFLHVLIDIFADAEFKLKKMKVSFDNLHFMCFLGCFRLIIFYN